MKMWIRRIFCARMNPDTLQVLVLDLNYCKNYTVHKAKLYNNIGPGDTRGLFSCVIIGAPTYDS